MAVPDLGAAGVPKTALPEKSSGPGKSLFGIYLYSYIFFGLTFFACIDNESLFIVINGCLQASICAT